jgi:hypothetical protein
VVDDEEVLHVEVNEILPRKRVAGGASGADGNGLAPKTTSLRMRKQAGSSKIRSLVLSG